MPISFRRSCPRCSHFSPKFRVLLSTIYHPLPSPAPPSSTCHRKSFVRPTSTRQIFSCNVQIAELARAGRIEAARRLFDEMPTRDVVSWNAIIAVYWQNGDIAESKRLFDSMPERNVVSWNSMIAGCIDNEKIDEACEYFDKMPERNIASWNAMISGFVRHRRIEEATRLFEEMPRRNVISYTAIVDGYAQIGDVDRARALFDRTPQKNAVSWTVMISGYVENGRFEEAKRLFDKMPKKTVVVLTAMVTGCCKEGRMEDARNLFEKIRNRDLVSWNAIISGYVHNGHGEEALKLHLQMLETGTNPDHATLVVVLTACSILVSLWHGRQTHALVVKYGFESNISVCNTLITMYSKSGSIHDSESVFRNINSPDVVSWNTIIAGYAQHGDYEKVLCLFDEMGANGAAPDGITFLNVLSACGHVGKVQESMDWFKLMVDDYGIDPTAEHYSCMVRILSRSGQMDKACEVIKEMPFEADGSVWGALLGACHIHLNVELAELASKKLVSLEPQNSGAYVILSNIYAAAGMWREVTRVRALMKEQGVKKQPGYSWMEIGSRLHLFLGGDVSHPEIGKIHLELDKISFQMKMMDDLANLELLNTL
ncbi:hypothetical protein ACLOJK_016363 [Asimina triloba]